MAAGRGKEGGESKNVTFLEPNGGEKPVVSLSFGSGGATTVSGFASHGPVCPRITDDFLKRGHNFLCQASLDFGKYFTLRAGCVFFFGSRFVHGGRAEQVLLLSFSQ